MLAAEMGSGQTQILAQEIGEVIAHLDFLVGVGLAVYRKRDLARFPHRLPSFTPPLLPGHKP